MNEMDIQPVQEQSKVVEWAIGKRAYGSEQNVSEMAVVKATPIGFLVAVIDGMNHSPKGVAAAKVAYDIFSSYTHQSLLDLFLRCDKDCKGYGGVSVSAAIINTGNHVVTWYGVGNVQGVLHHRSPSSNPRLQNLDQHPGLVGDGQFRFREFCITVKPGDMLILATEALNHTFAEALPMDGRPRQVADELLNTYAPEGVNTMLVVARYLGTEAQQQGLETSIPPKF